MAVESATKLASLNAAWPLGTDAKSEGDNHIRLVKSVVKGDALSKADGGAVLGNVSIGPTDFVIGTAQTGLLLGVNGTIYSKRAGSGNQAHYLLYNKVDTVPTLVGSLATTAAYTVVSNDGGTGILLRPVGVSSSAGQVTISPAGTLTTSAAIVCATGATFGATSGSGSDPNPGISISELGFAYIKRVGTANQSHLVFYNNAAVSPVAVGTINTSGSATTYNTSSDEHLKTFTGALDPQAAIDIIRADPVREFNWKNGAGHAIGWGAQSSYALSQDLATPPPAPEDPDAPQPQAGEAGYQPWGMDLGKRTPYLWAALSAALDRIDELVARVAALEAA